MLQGFNFTVYALLDPEVSLSFVNPYIVMNFENIFEQLSEPLSVSTAIGLSNLGERVYHSCDVFVSYKTTRINLIELDMVHYDVILGMDLFHFFYASVYYRTRVVMFQFPNESVL